MGDGALACDSYGLAVASEHAPRADERLRGLLEGHFTFIWRLLRRLGVPENDADDAAQQVFIVASRKLDSIAATAERSFLFGIALRVASSTRRSLRQRVEVDDTELVTLADGSIAVDEAVARRQGVEILDRIVAALPEELRLVFVLCEIEELSVPEVAELQGIPVGTAASRLRRARKEFNDAARRIWRNQRMPRGAGP